MRRAARASSPPRIPRCIRGARVELDGRAIGFVGELHPRWRQAYELPAAPVLFELEAGALLEARVPAFAPLPRQQSVWRDLALIVSDTVTHDALVDAVGAGPQRLVRSAALFDVYRPAAPTAEIGAHEHSAALRLELRDDEAPLTDARIEAEVAAVLAALQQRLGARLRG